MTSTTSITEWWLTMHYERNCKDLRSYRSRIDFRHPCFSLLRRHLLTRKISGMPFAPSFLLTLITLNESSPSLYFTDVYTLHCCWQRIFSATDKLPLVFRISVLLAILCDIFPLIFYDLREGEWGVFTKHGIHTRGTGQSLGRKCQVIEIVPLYSNAI